MGDFAPTIGCRWTPPEAPPGASAEAIEIASMSDVVMTPSVANLTDDNGDGVDRRVRYPGHRVRELQPYRKRLLYQPRRAAQSFLAPATPTER